MYFIHVLMWIHIENGRISFLKLNMENNFYDIPVFKLKGILSKMNRYYKNLKYYILC